MGSKFSAMTKVAAALVARGDNIRALRLSEIGLMYFKKEGYFINTHWKKSKMNKFRTLEETNFIR